MIVYKLLCADGHEFDGWFASSTAFDQQKAAGQLMCPYCGSGKVEKAMMAPAVSGAKKPTLSDAEMKKVRKVMAGLRRHVLETGENVGKDFPEEARKIHYGEAEMRQIYGEATLEDVTELTDEGIEVAPLPPDFDETIN